MLPRDRVHAALDFTSSDVVPLRIAPAAGGFYEHGQKLLDLIKTMGHDFGDVSHVELPPPPGPEDFDADGRYYAIRTDDWGTTWEYRIFGVWGHPIHLPLGDLSRVGSYRPPHPPATIGPEFERARAASEEHRKTWFQLGGWVSIFEKLCSIRGFEDTLVDIVTDSPEIHKAEDMLIEYGLACVDHALALGVDAVQFGDDFGTQQAALFSPEVWKRFFKSRYEVLFEPVRRAGKRIFFHCCGQVSEMLDEFCDLGIDAIWPQLPAFDLPELARRCHDLGMAVELHPDRGDLMQRATPREVRDYVLRLVDTFGMGTGGSWLYLEIDPGFPWANVEALFETARVLRQRA